MYDLAVDGVTDFYLRRPGGQRLVRLQPLVGVADGTNKVFQVANPPLLEASLHVYAPNTLIDLAVTTIDADGGVVQLYAAPTMVPKASYTAVPVTTTQIKYFAWAGYQLMEALWSRGLMLSSNNAAYVQASPSDTHIYVVNLSTDGATVQDPVSGANPDGTARTFSTSQAQRNFLARCIEMAYIDSLMNEAAAGDLDIRERAGGIAINAARRPANLLAARSEFWTELMRSLYAAMDEYYPGGDHYGAYVEPPHSTEYEAIWRWQATDTGNWIPGSLYLPWVNGNW